MGPMDRLDVRLVDVFRAPKGLTPELYGMEKRSDRGQSTMRLFVQVCSGIGVVEQAKPLQLMCEKRTVIVSLDVTDLFRD
jgi:hypothetical protein